MPKSENLFKLVKSLSRGEVKFFRSNIPKATNSKPNKYVFLFNVIALQQSYNETKLIRKVYPEGISSAKFRVLKHQLFKLLIKSLRHYNEESSVTSEIQSGLQTVEVLCNKMFYHEAIDELDKLKDKAVFAVQYHEIIHFWEFKVAHESGNVELMETLVEQWQEDNSGIRLFGSRQSATIIAFSKLFIKLRRKGVLPIEERQKFLEDLEPELQVLDDDSLLSRHLKMYMKALSLFMILDKAGFNIAQESLVNHLEVTHKDDQNFPFFYVTALSDVAMSFVVNGQIAKGKLYLEKMHKELEQLPRGIRFRNMLNYYKMMLAINNEQGDFDKNLILLEEIQTIEKDYGVKFPPSFSIHFAYFNFGLEHYEDALDWIDISIKTFKREGRNDLEGLQRIIQIIIVFELGESYEPLLESLIRSAYRIISMTNWPFKLEKLFLRFVKKAGGFKTKKELIKGFETLRSDLEELYKDSSMADLIVYFDFASWLTSKIEKISFKTAIEQKLNKSVGSSSAEK